MNPKCRAVLRRAKRDGKDQRLAVLEALADDTTAVLATLPANEDPAKLAAIIDLIDAIDMGWVSIYRQIPNAKIGDYERVITMVNPTFARLWKEDSVTKTLANVRGAVEKVMGKL